MAVNSDLRDLLSAAGDIAYDWDQHSDVIAWYGAIDKLFGTTGPPKNSQALYDILHPDDRHIVFSGDLHALDRQFRIRQSDGSVLWVHERGTGVDDTTAANKILRQQGIWRVIDPMAQLAIPAEAQSRDTLTGCFKRRVLQSHLARAIDNAKTARRVGAYLVVGVDKMSFVNEAVGTEAGDAVLRAVAIRLTQLIPTRAMLGRVSGDVFGILLPEPLGNDLFTLAERIIQDFRNVPVSAVKTSLHLTVSIGGVRVPSVAKTGNEAMIYAEQALHMARQRGRNMFVEYVDSPERAQENRQVFELSERIKRAFKADGFKLAYQPIVDGDKCQPIFYEALVRMFSDDGKPVAAAHFVPLIEQMGLAVELDKLVLDIAVREMEAMPWLHLAINISGLTASQADWPEHIRHVLEPRPDVARRLVVEITETAAIVDIGETRRFIDTMRELGGSVALDDFGAGSTSIRYLRELGLSIMKIDKDLLNGLTTNKEQQHLVGVLIELAKGLGIKTVAEGVETQEVATWLQQAKVDYLQGYFFGKPSLDLPAQHATQAQQAGAAAAAPVSAPAAYAAPRSATTHH